MDIKINRDEWLQISDEDKEKIKNIISHNFKEAHQIDADSSAPPSAQRSMGEQSVQSFISNPLCTAACSVAEAAAVAACSALSGGIAIAACIAAAHEAGNYCRSKC